MFNLLGGIKRSRSADCEQEDECLGMLIVISCTWFQKFSEFLSLVGYCQSEVSATVAETPQVEACTVPYFFFFVTAATDRPSTAGCSQTIQIIHASL